ncbi:bacteriohemerythrin [Thauera mechernichensis]|uniref:Bacteriohemerythrin n=1 Tax=Thauera mechernichensis TaxID=82788 RepID=A0ABW3WBD8_9RHOO|nr:bacteriohemerythrin [Thauera mechernichensis]MDG3064305.1 bacteriohemerythrin [Thauera mechernichensis]
MRSIDIFPWHSNFDTGIAGIDAQHRRLVELLNRLAGKVALSATVDSMLQVFDALADYAVQHFEYEEAVWHDCLADEPAEAQHRETHQSFVEEVCRLRGELAASRVDAVASETLEFLVRWLAAHILQADRYMALVVRARQRGMAGESAHAWAREQMSGTARALTDIILEMYAAHSHNTVSLIRELAAHRQSDVALERQQAYRNLILRLAISFVNLPLERMDNAIAEALAEMSGFFAADRAYVFDYDFVDQTATNTFEWCAPGVAPMIAELQRLPLSLNPDWVVAHRAGEPLVVPDVSDLPSGCGRALLEAQGIRSLLTAPLLDGRDCLGFVGFDSVQDWRSFGQDESELLKLFANLLVSLRQRCAVAEALRDSEQRYRRLFEQSHDALMIVAPPDWRFQAGNPAMIALFGARDLEQLLTMTPGDVSPPFQPDGRASAEAARELIAHTLRAGVWSGEWVHRRLDGRELTCTVTLTRTEIGGQTVVQGTVRDVTQQKAQQRQLERIAHYDALTSLPNRVLLADRLQQAMASAHRRETTLAIAYLDLDGFKAVNDRHGHDAGDRLLVAIAERMRRALRETDTLARLGGDEFVAVLIDLPGPDACLPMIGRLLEAAAAEMIDDGYALRVSASLGVTFYPQPEPIDADQLLRQADQAMYQAKLAGKSRYHLFDVDRDRALRGRHESLARLARALADGEFVLFYQPKVNMRSGEVLGLEALIRWQHPDGRLVPPLDFLPLIEEQPLELELGNWVIDTALAQMAAWRCGGLELPVSVNVSASQLQHPGFVAALEQALARHSSVPPDWLELEILESSALQDIELVIRVMGECAALGVGFALDDFGTGYSSLTYLKRLPAGTLKIDRSFVRGMLDDSEDRAILEGVLGLARAFRRTPVAEGVETVRQGAVLLDLGCDVGQGYGIARPMPAASVSDWIRSWKPAPDWRALP